MLCFISELGGVTLTAPSPFDAVTAGEQIETPVAE